MSLSGRHVLITGGTSGIGLGLARECVRRGAHRLTLTARRAPSTALLAELGALYVQMDVGDRNSVQQGFHRGTAGGTHPVDVLICSAGKMHSALVEDESPESSFNMLNVNLMGPWACVHQVLPSMKERNSGGIILIGSEASLIGIYGYGAYSASKFGVRGLAEALYMETEGYEVHTCLVLPPAVDTPGLDEENRDKLEITKVIEDVGGVLKVDQVARKTMDAFDKGYRRVTFGVMGWLMSLATAGLAPVNSWVDLIGEVLLSGVLRVAISVLQAYWKFLIRSNVKAKRKTKGSVVQKNRSERKNE
eukprot:GHVS01045654.1.p1 GENE.GHVS01045654.1~~GHVS01045654.1.p1  ORF type:complete len:315 (+),score=36.45 GHVS01045654.1:33-947(+)